MAAWVPWQQACKAAATSHPPALLRLLGGCSKQPLPTAHLADRCILCQLCRILLNAPLRGAAVAHLQRRPPAQWSRRRTTGQVGGGSSAPWQHRCASCITPKAAAARSPGSAGPRRPPASRTTWQSARRPPHTPCMRLPGRPGLACWSPQGSRPAAPAPRPPVEVQMEGGDAGAWAAAVLTQPQPSRSCPCPVRPLIIQRPPAIAPLSAAAPPAATDLDARQHALAGEALSEGRAVVCRLEQRLLEENGAADARLANGRGVKQLAVAAPRVLQQARQGPGHITLGPHVRGARRGVGLADRGSTADAHLGVLVPRLLQALADSSGGLVARQQPCDGGGRSASESTAAGAGATDSGPRDPRPPAAQYSSPLPGAASCAAVSSNDADAMAAAGCCGRAAASRRARRRRRQRRVGVMARPIYASPSLTCWHTSCRTMGPSRGPDLRACPAARACRHLHGRQRPPMGSDHA